MIIKNRAKLMGVATIASLSLAVAAPQAYATAGWDYMGSSGFHQVGPYFYSGTFNSHGGNVKVCITTSESGNALYGLYEYDPDGTSINTDERIGSNRVQTAGGCETWDVSGYVDGSNARAEVYISTNDSKAYKAEFWD
ncbi:hypothetical protein [Streptomyces sp. NPDC020330]|uniref:hypothetical protein n=1 Tax=unclassified Streptomyces TaxID=2593676 RepID=UPI0037B48D40